MTTATPTRVEQIGELLERAYRSAMETAADLAEIDEICTHRWDGEGLGLTDVYALVGRAEVVRRKAKWALEAADKAVEALVQQVYGAEQNEGLWDVRDA